MDDILYTHSPVLSFRTLTKAQRDRHRDKDRKAVEMWVGRPGFLTVF